MSEILKKRDIPTTIAYYRGRWVYVPLFYLQDKAIQEQALSIGSSRRSCDVAYERSFKEARETILPDQLTPRELLELCGKNDIPLSWLKKQDNSAIRNKTLKEKKESKIKKRKLEPLSPEEFRKFIKALEQVNKQSALIARILWFLNRKLKEVFESVTLDELLCLIVSGVDSEDDDLQCIYLTRYTSADSRILVHYLPDYLWRRLSRQIVPDSLFVFSNKKGGPLLNHNIADDFMVAGERSIGKPVTSLSLRLIKKPVREKLASKELLKYSERNLKEISEQEWERLRKHVLGLKIGKGRASQYDQRLVFNAILFHYRTGTSWRRLPEEFPPGKAVNSQYRRWQKKGVIDDVLAFRV